MSSELAHYLNQLLEATDAELAGPLKDFADKFVEEFEKNMLDEICIMHYKRCAGCGVLVARRRALCPDCKTYRFENP